VTAANALKAAGCAAGFGDGSFGYNSTVTRGQDAIFQMACAPGAAYENAGSTAGTNFSAPSATPTTLGTETITAGINPGGLQVLLVHAHAVLTANQSPSGPVTGGAATAAPTLAVSPSAGGTAASPSSVSCVPVSASTGVLSSAGLVPVQPNSASVDCDGGFVVPTGQAVTITFSATVTAVSSAATPSATLTPGTLTAWTTPRGNTVSSTTSLS
jgi:hypothetical protein